jgi:2,4-dienoyl-CoA reductase-like NADH-dependent reductase (Old Yellow Enzyme family)
LLISYRHGYLLAQFMSPQTNLRNDEFGGSAAKRVEVVLRIIRRIRQATSKEFCIGIKLNSVDASSSESPADTIEQIKLIAECGIDFVEISGGTYESPRMVGPDWNASKPIAEKTTTTNKSTVQRESFFLEFAKEVREKFPSVVLMVTGGFRTRRGMEDALQSGACDLIGIARPAAVLPKLPKEIILNAKIPDAEATVALARVKNPLWMEFFPLKQVGAGYQTVFYAGQIQRMGEGLRPIYTKA